MISKRSVLNANVSKLWMGQARRPRVTRNIKLYSMSCAESDTLYTTYAAASVNQRALNLKKAMKASQRKESRGEMKKRGKPVMQYKD